MASKEWWASLVLVLVALLTARLVSSWGQSGKGALKPLKRRGANRKTQNG